VTVNATWSKALGPLTILAFGDHSYTLMLGSRRKPPLVVVGWASRRPNFIDVPRFRRRA
jgi:hypothetical protein